jgi:transposase-like protein
VAAVAKRHGISEQTIYTWRKRFGGLQAREVKRLRQLEAENGRLKKLVASAISELLALQHEFHDIAVELHRESRGSLGEPDLALSIPTSEKQIGDRL